MTELSNIFYGKKVIQQVFMNNATMYKSKGWETLPSTYQEQYSIAPAKLYNTGQEIRKIVSDDKGNIIVLTVYNLYCFNSAGDNLWTVDVRDYGNSNVNTVFNDCIVVNDYVWACSDGFIYIFVIKNGVWDNTITSNSLTVPAVSNCNYFHYLTSLTLHNNKVYVGHGCTYNTSNGSYTASTIGYSVVNPDGSYIANSTVLLATQKGMGGCNNILSTIYKPTIVHDYMKDLYWDKDGNLYFVCSRTNVVQYNLKNSSARVIPIPDNTAVPADLSVHITVDSLGYLYLACVTRVWKFDLDVTKPVLWVKVTQEQIQSIGGMYSLYVQGVEVDSQDNCYVQSTIHLGSYYTDRYGLYKFSSDGTLIWNRQKQDYNNGISAAAKTSLYIDSQDTIYDCRYGLSGSQLTPVITKMINLVKTT